MVTIAVDQLKKSFMGHDVLKSITFQAHKGDVWTILGSSGSGKSTLLRCINLLTLPDAGKVTVNGMSWVFSAEQKLVVPQHDLIKLRTKIGMVFQQFNLWQHLTLLENLLEAPIQVLKQDKKIALERAGLLLEKVGLANKQNSYPHQLSGGQQQRAAIARALMMQPEVMLFDEPTSALDPEMVAEVLCVMQTLAQEGMTMLIATHELNFARKVASHAMFLDEGNILESGTAAQLFNQPQTERFTKFLQAMQH